MPEHKAEKLAAASASPPTMPRQGWDEWLVYLMRGLFALALAFFSFFWPTQTIGLFTKLLGIYFIAEGVINSIVVIKRKGSVAFMAPFIVGILIGLVLLFLSAASARVFMIVVGIWAIIQGTGTLVAIWNSRTTIGNQRHGTIVGLLMLVVGLAFVIWPTTGIVAMSWLIAFGSLIVGLVLVFMGSRLWNLKKLAAKSRPDGG